MKTLAKICSFLLVLMTTVMPVQAIEIPPSTDEYYLDDANVLSQETEDYISEKNYYLDRHCGAYIEIITEKYINCDVADYTYKIQNDWEISDNGFTFVLVTEEEKYYLMWGREIETKIDSYVFDEILETYFEKDFDAGNYDKAVRNTYDAIYSEIVKIYGEPTTTEETKTEHSIWSSFFGFIVFILLILAFIKAVSNFFGLFTGFGLFSLFSRRSRRNNYYRNEYSYSPRREYGSNHHFSGGSSHSSYSGSSHSSYSGSSHSSSSSSSRPSGGRSHGGGGRGAGSGRR